MTTPSYTSSEPQLSGDGEAVQVLFRFGACAFKATFRWLPVKWENTHVGEGALEWGGSTCSHLEEHAVLAMKDFRRRNLKRIEEMLEKRAAP
jgi:hypothetical protein